MQYVHVVLLQTKLWYVMKRSLLPSCVMCPQTLKTPPPLPSVEVDQQDAVASFKIPKKFVDSNRGTAF